MEYNVLFVSALPIELKTIKEELKKIKVKNIKFSFLLSGVGNYNTIYNLKNYFDNNVIDFVVNIGVCGKIQNGIDDFFQVYRIKNNSNNREVLVPIYIKELNLESILSSEKLITNNQDILDEKYVDMESFGIDYVCVKEKVPFVIIKKPFDLVSDNSNKVNLELLKKSLIGFNYTRLFYNILKYLSMKSDNTIDLSYYKNYFNFTFSEFEKFKKLYNKFLALKRGNFQTYFEANKYKSKKEFLISLGN